MSKLKNIAVSIAIAVSVSVTAMAELYPATMEVTDINPQTEEVTVEDFNGNMFSFYGAEDLFVGDSVSVIFDDMGTSCIYDDEIKIVNYAGWKLEK